MKIELTKEEYRYLLDLLYTANWVLNAHKAEEDPRTKPYDKVIQKIYSLARPTGFGSLIEYDPHDRRYYPTGEFEDATEAAEFIDEYVDDTFWDELVYRLSERDAAHRVGGYEQFRLLSPEDRTALETPAHERYAEEFKKNGIQHLVITEEFGLSAAKPVKTSD